MKWTIKNLVILTRNRLFRFFYIYILKPIYFYFDPEKTHDAMVRTGSFLGRYSTTRSLISFLFSFSHPTLEQNILNIHFPNPIGLAAGFDKDALLTEIIPAVGFGFTEVGSITGESCDGNMKPRLWRLKNSQALMVYYGLKNEGCEKIALRLKGMNFKVPVGTNIAKTNSKITVETEAGINDYVKAFRQFVDIGQYFAINISCPNAFGGEPFSNIEKLDRLLSMIDTIKTIKPIFLKLSPDLNEEQIEAILKVCEKHRVHGFICSNLTKNKNNLKIKDAITSFQGGISGKVVDDLSLNQIRLIYQKTKGKYIIIGCGGIFSALDAYKKIKAGASLVQIITGMIFEGPELINEINRGLVLLLKRDGFHNIKDAIGKE